MKHELRIAHAFQFVAVAYCTAGDWIETFAEADCVGPETDTDDYLEYTIEAFRRHLDGGEVLYSLADGREAGR